MASTRDSETSMLWGTPFSDPEIGKEPIFTRFSGSEEKDRVRGG
jgi:hypothetical protein